MTNKVILGIDLGTTNCSVSIMQGNEVKIFIDNRENRVPSVVHFSKKNDELKFEVGKRAEKFLLREPEMTVFDSKRMLGRQFNDPDIQKLIPQWPFKVKEDEDGKILIVLEKINTTFKPYEISGYILKHLAEVGNKYLKSEEKTSEVIITIPANFGDEQREETLKAAAFANLKVLEMINEPTSAGISYGMREKSTKSSNIIVFDFGGGTLDISFLSLNNNDFNILGSDGDMFLGGRNFDDNIVNFLIKKFDLEELRNDAKIMENVRESAIKAKEDLSELDETEIELDINDEDCQYLLTLEEFNKINQELIDKIITPVERLLKNLKKTKDDVNYVLLVGGSSNMKFVKEKLTAYFDEEPFYDINAGTAVARGAAYVASEYSRASDADTDKNPESIFKTFKYHDICAFSIGTQIYGGEFCPIIDKGSSIPTKESERFTTVLYRQESIDIYIFQGDSYRASDNYCLGHFSVSGLPPSNDPIDFELTLSLDKSGVLSATAALLDTSVFSETKLKVLKIRKGKMKINHDSKSENGNKEQMKLILINIQRFIKFNKDDIISRKCYSQSELDAILKDANYLENNPDCDEFPDDFESLISRYRYKLKNYLNKFKPHEIPRFLQSLTAY